MKYKVGDEVMVKAKITKCNGDGTYKSETNYSILTIGNKDIQKSTDMTAEEAWEIAKKLFADYSNAELDEIFGKGWSFPKLMELTPQQAKARIEVWKAEKGIEVGDEVALKDNPYKDDSKFFVTKLDKKENRISGVSGFDGGVFWGRNIMKYQKTGRHIDIDGFLKQIGGDE